MATTTNFGWETPDDTDLVKDGAAAMRTLGSAIDTSLVDLKGGTTGQVLSKASNTDMDFTWTAIDPLVILDAKGDLISATAADTPARLAVGSNGQVLTADSTTATGLKWATPASTPSFIGCSLTRTSNQTISNATDTAIAWNSEIYDTDGFHDNTTNNSRITIPSGKGGKYQFNFVLRWNGNSTGFRNHKLFINGSEGGSLIRYTNLSADATIMNGSFVLDLAAGDYVQLYAFQSSGGNLDLSFEASTQLSAGLRFTCQYLGA